VIACVRVAATWKVDRFPQQKGSPTPSKVLARPIRFQKVPGPAYQATLVEHGQSEAFAQGLIDMFREIAGGIHAADPRTPESTTPTTFESWCGDTLKPAIG
jgi:hypothetical protein